MGSVICASLFWSAWVDTVICHFEGRRVRYLRDKIGRWIRG